RIGDHDLQERRGDAREARGGRITAVAARADIGTADGGQALGAEGPDVQGTRVAGAVAGFVLIAVVGRRPAHRARMSRRVLAVVAAAITLVAAAGVPVAGAGPAARLLRVRRAVGPGPGTVLGEVALAGGGAADDARGLEAVRGTRGARAVAGLGHVAVARGRPAHRTGIPRGVLAVVPAAVAGVDRARVPVIGAGGVRGLLRVDRAVGAVPGTVLGEVALAIGRAADDARELEVVGGTAVAGAVAGLDRVAGTSRGAADRAGRALGIRGARRAGARAGLGDVAVPGGRAAHRAPIPCRMLAVIAAAVALVAAARIAIVGARDPAGLLRIRRAVGTVAGTSVGHF